MDAVTNMQRSAAAAVMGAAAAAEGACVRGLFWALLLLGKRDCVPTQVLQLFAQFVNII